MKKFKFLKNKFKKFLKKNKKLVNFLVKFFIVLKFVLDVVDLVLKLKDLCPWLGSLINQLNHEGSGYLAILFKNNFNEKPLVYS